MHALTGQTRIGHRLVIGGAKPGRSIGLLLLLRNLFAVVAALHPIEIALPSGNYPSDIGFTYLKNGLAGFLFQAFHLPFQHDHQSDDSTRGR